MVNDKIRYFGNEIGTFNFILLHSLINHTPCYPYHLGRRLHHHQQLYSRTWHDNEVQQEVVVDELEKAERENATKEMN